MQQEKAINARQAMLRRVRNTSRKVDLSDGLFDKQKSLFYEKSQKVVADCGRRAGKTTTLARMALDTAINNPQEGGDDSIIPYIAPTKNQAKRLMWGRLQILAKLHKIPLDYNSTDLIATHPNGAQIWLMGANDDRDVERLRGFSYRRVLIDEAQAIGSDFKILIDETIGPALGDFDGQLIITGTPNAACVGYFWECCTGQKPKWAHHHWTITDNEMFPMWRNKDGWEQIADKWLDDYRVDNGWSIDNPTYQREWLGNWVRDVGGLVYHCEDWNTYGGELPEGYHWLYVMGADFGFDDSFACTVWAFSEDLPTLYEVETVKYNNKPISDWAGTMQRMIDRYKPVASVADTGALGKAIAAEITQRHGIPLEPAQKADKAGNIAMVNSGFADRRVFVIRNGYVHNEMKILQWDEKRLNSKNTNKNSTNKKVEDDRFANDACDAALYSFMKAQHYLHADPEYVPPMGTAARANYEMDQLEKEECDRMEQQQEQEWWE